MSVVTADSLKTAPVALQNHATLPSQSQRFLHSHSNRFCSFNICCCYANDRRSRLPVCSAGKMHPVVLKILPTYMKLNRINKVFSTRQYIIYSRDIQEIKRYVLFLGFNIVMFFCTATFVVSKAVRNNVVRECIYSSSNKRSKYVNIYYLSREISHSSSITLRLSL